MHVCGMMSGASWEDCHGSTCIHTCMYVEDDDEGIAMEEAHADMYVCGR
jgi:hypothetical protein